jgi:hypothetical protein
MKALGPGANQLVLMAVTIVAYLAIPYLGKDSLTHLIQFDR